MSVTPILAALALVGFVSFTSPTNAAPAAFGIGKDLSADARALTSFEPARFGRHHRHRGYVGFYRPRFYSYYYAPYYPRYNAWRAPRWYGRHW